MLKKIKHRNTKHFQFNLQDKEDPYIYLRLRDVQVFMDKETRLYLPVITNGGGGMVIKHHSYKLSNIPKAVVRALGKYIKQHEQGLESDCFIIDFDNII